MGVDNKDLCLMVSCGDSVKRTSKDKQRPYNQEKFSDLTRKLGCLESAAKFVFNSMSHLESFGTSQARYLTCAKFTVFWHNIRTLRFI